MLKSGSTPSGGFMGTVFGPGSPPKPPEPATKKPALISNKCSPSEEYPDTFVYIIAALPLSYEWPL